MFAFLRNLLGGVARFALGGMAYGWYWTGRFVGGMRDALSQPVQGSDGTDRIIEAIHDAGVGGAQRAMAEAVAAAPEPVRDTRADAEAKRTAQLAALRYTTAGLYGGPRPSLEGVPEQVARRLAKLSTRAEFAPIHRDLVKACGFECRAGWWDGPNRNRANDDDVVERRTVKLAY